MTDIAIERKVRLDQTRRERARKMVAFLKKMYPKPKSELTYKTQFQFVVAVMLSAQCTDKVVNRVTDSLFKKYKTPLDFALAKPADFVREISSVTFFQNKAKAVIAAAKKIIEDFGGRVPRNADDLQKLPGVGYKTAHVIIGELFDEWPGIPTDTHVRRFALRFDLTHHKDLNKISKELEALVPKKDWKYVNNGLVLYGRYICKAGKHDCSTHKLTALWPPSRERWPKAK